MAVRGSPPMKREKSRIHLRAWGDRSCSGLPHVVWRAMVRSLEQPRHLLLRLLLFSRCLGVGHFLCRSLLTPGPVSKGSAGRS